MILTIDIGNTTANFGVFERGKLRSTFSIATQPKRAKRALAAQLRRRRSVLAHADELIVCSVVPWMSSVLIRSLRTLTDASIRLVGRDVRVPLLNRYHYPKQVGQDRLVGAYAALKAFQRDCIIADFGTAITIDVAKFGARGGGLGEYLGGIIAPGLGISLDALANRTALLPKVELRRPPELLGRDTANSIRSGILYGCVALCDGLVTQLKRRYAPKALVVATGGASALIASQSRTIDRLSPHLVLDGLYRLNLYCKNKLDYT